jgi:acetolactate synthase-1/2/3 large subunit
MKLSDYLVDALASAGVKTIFGVTGGSIVHPLHSAEKHPKLKVIYTHHEQAAAFAADAIGHFPGQIGACFVTTGPGGTNAITGLTSAWLDSAPVIFISGQARSEHLTGPNTVRQIGSQHIDIISVVKPLTKFAAVIESLSDTRAIVEEAIYRCQEGRPGPVWIDIPLDFQWSDVNISSQVGFVKINEEDQTQNHNIHTLIAALMKSSRPLIVAGTGIKLSGMVRQFKGLIENAQIPCVFTWNTLDILESKNILNMGLIGISGSREANLAARGADLIIAIGSHLSNQLIGSVAEEFAPSAEIYVVDIDKRELERLPARFKKINVNLKFFLDELKNEMGKKVTSFNFVEWQKRCEDFKRLRDYGVPINLDSNSQYVSLYYFYKRLSFIFEAGDKVVIDGGGNTLFSALNSLQFKDLQSVISGAGIGCMGSGLPHAVGAAYATNSGKVYCLIGDGSMQFNIQELSTIELNNLPIKIVVINNDGYKAIKDTQDNFFDRRFGVDRASGLSLPSYRQIAEAYRVKYFSIHEDAEVDAILSRVASNDEPCICEVFVDPNIELLPRAGFVKMDDGTTLRLPTHDMHPKIPRILYEQFNL